MSIATDGTDLVGETPLVRLDAFAPNLVGKLEFLNPTNSVKDRIGAAMLDRAAAAGYVDGTDPAALAASLEGNNLPEAAD